MLFAAPICFLLGIGMFYGGGHEMWIAHTSQSWPTTNAKITVSDIDESHDDDGTTYKANLAYDYSVKGKAHKGYGISPTGAPSASNRSTIEAFIAKYPEGSTQTVHYDPGNPEVVLLQVGTGGSSEPYILMGIGAVLALVGAGMGLKILYNIAMGKGVTLK